jgi:hypothetical protein
LILLLFYSDSTVAVIRIRIYLHFTLHFV